MPTSSPEAPAVMERASEEEDKRLSTQIYLAVWRWHFWSGLLITPVLIIVSLTGSIYVFKAEIERWLYPEVMFVEPVGEAGLVEGFISAINAEYRQHEISFVNFYEDPERAWEAFGDIHGENGEHLDVRRFYYDPYREKLLGTLDNETEFFRVVLAIHRRLFAGTPGRIIVETATCWDIISMLAGLYLWWPKGKAKIWGVWLPRIRGRARVILRDWHTVPGVYMVLFVIMIMFTGLLFTRIWGTGYRAGNALTGGFPDFFLNPPQSQLPEGDEPPSQISIDQALSTANELFPFWGTSYGIRIVETGSEEAYQVVSSLQEASIDRGVVFIDQYSGDVLVFETNEDLPLRTHLTLLFYPIHVGSIFGTPTKIIAVIACFLIMTMSSTGVIMWWKRRPSGKLGAPKKPPHKIVPRWLAWSTVSLAIFLPTVGLTLLLIILGQRVGRILR